MTSRSTSNVVPFALPDSAPPPRQSAEGARLLAECRDRLAHAVATVFAGNLGAAREDLLGMADRATSLEQQQLQFAALELLANRSQALLEHFRSAYVTQFDAALGWLRGGQRRDPSQREDAAELSLVATDDFERDLAIGKLSARAACNCAQQLIALDRQFAALLRLPRIGQDDNPLYPRAIFTALLQALSDMGVGEHLALVLLQEFERQTSAELPGVYNDLTRHLADSGVLPRLPAGWPRPAPRLEPLTTADPGAGEPARALPPLAAGPGQRPASAAPSLQSAEPALYADPQAGGDEVFAALARAIQTAAAARFAKSAAPTVPPMQQPMSVSAPLEHGTALGLSRLIEALTGLQRGHPDPRGAPGLGPVRIDSERGNVIRQLRTPLASATTPVDALTIDIVAMLFDAIFSDPDLPATLRAEIARLQIPVLKVALMDRAFFSNKRHPARRLLDVIASSGIGRNDRDEPRLIDKIHTIVDEVVSGFETDIDLFATQVAKLEEFLADEEARAHSRTTPMVDRLAEQDRQERARARAAAEIDSRVGRGPVPALVAEFLNRHWRQVLISAFARGGEQDAPWIDALGTMDDLVWSVVPKQGPAERNRLLTTLPDLLKRLRVGLESVNLNEAWDPFFAHLIRLHVGALHNDLPEEDDGAAGGGRGGPTGDGPAPRGRTPGPLGAAPGIAFRGQVSSTHPGTHQAVAPEDRHWELARSLEVGAWVEFESLRDTRKTLRVSWVSDLRGVFLFTNRQGENALTLTTTSLAEHLRRGRARVLSPTRLTDRAVARLLDEHRHQQQHEHHHEQRGGTPGLSDRG